MSDAATLPMHPIATEHLPPFVTAPGSIDVLLVVTGLFLLLAVVGIGVFFFALHSLPEQLAHKGQMVQFEIVGVLALISLFTHNHAYWIAALLLAFIPLPDFVTPLRSMAQSLGQIAVRRAPAEEGAAPADSPVAGVRPDSATVAGATAPDRPDDQSSTAAHRG